MAMNPLAVSQSGVQVPGVQSQPYPDLGPAQGGIGAGAEGGGLDSPQSDRDKVAEVVRLATVVGIQAPKDLMSFLAGLGFQTASRLAKPSLPRGITDDPNTPSPGPAQPPQPPAMGATPMPPGPGM